MGILDFLFGIKANNSSQKQANNSHDRGFEEGYDECCMDHECDEDCNNDSLCDNYEDESCYEEHDCDCDYEDFE